MQQAADQTHRWTNFLSALALFAQAGVRLPFGVPDPVLSGGSAVELYSGGLWSATDFEVIASDARKLVVELFAVGFRWSERPRYVGRGLWHPELQIGMNIIEPRATPSVAEQANRLFVVLELERPGLTDGVLLKVVGIEDLIAQQAGCWLRDEHPQESLSPGCRHWSGGRWSARRELSAAASCSGDQWRSRRRDTAVGRG
jgi:hypothetical protein